MASGKWVPSDTARASAAASALGSARRASDIASLTSQATTKDLKGRRLYYHAQELIHDRALAAGGALGAEGWPTLAIPAPGTAGEDVYLMPDGAAWDAIKTGQKSLEEWAGETRGPDRPRRRTH